MTGRTWLLMLVALVCAAPIAQAATRGGPRVSLSLAGQAPAAVEAGKTLAFSVRNSNAGGTRSPTMLLVFRLKPKTGKPTRLGEFTARGVRPGRSRRYAVSFTVPAATAAGRYTLQACRTVRRKHPRRNVTVCVPLVQVRVTPPAQPGGGPSGDGSQPSGDTTTPPDNGSGGDTTPAPDTTPPAFAGLARVCPASGIASLDGTYPFSLEWQAATDGTTAQSAIVYDIYAASSPGGENFAAAPTATTAPGATSATVRWPQPDHFFAVVRARDQAGNRDTNTVERSPDPSCPPPP